MAFLYSVLVVASRTAASDELVAALRARAERGPVRFTLLVPARAAGPQAREAATQQLELALERMRAAGLDVEGRIGGSDPIAAVGDAWDPKEFDEVVVSTLPGATSRWLQVDLPHRVARMTGVQVTHVLSSERRPAASEQVAERDRPGLLSPLSVLTWGGARSAGERPEGS